MKAKLKSIFLVGACISLTQMRASPVELVLKDGTQLIADTDDIIDGKYRVNQDGGIRLIDRNEVDIFRFPKNETIPQPTHSETIKKQIQPDKNKLIQLTTHTEILYANELTFLSTGNIRVLVDGKSRELNPRQINSFSFPDKLTHPAGIFPANINEIQTDYSLRFKMNMSERIPLSTILKEARSKLEEGKAHAWAYLFKSNQEAKLTVEECYKLAEYIGCTQPKSTEEAIALNDEINEILGTSSIKPEISTPQKKSRFEPSVSFEPTKLTK